MDLFRKYCGIIEDIQKNDKVHRIFIKDENDSPQHFEISTDSFTLDDLSIGDEVIAFTMAFRPEVMIYPPRHFTDIIIKKPENLFVKADYFDSNLISGDRTLRLNISDNTIVQDSTKNTTSAIGDTAMLVFYDISTRSIPAITNPKRVYILNTDLTAYKNHLFQ